jgi:hypothetical protein
VELDGWLEYGNGTKSDMLSRSSYRHTFPICGFHDFRTAVHRNMGINERNLLHRKLHRTDNAGDNIERSYKRYG